MKAIRLAMRFAVLMLACITVFGVPPCSAQTSMPSGDGRSLGGYGGSVLNTGSDVGMSGTIIPYGGMSFGFTPYRSGGGRTLSFESRGTANFDAPRKSFSMSPLSSKGPSISRGLGTLGERSGTFSLLGSTGLGSALPPIGKTRALGSVMPPNFGSPFRQPPSLFSTNASSGGP